MWNNSKKIMGVESLALLALILSVMVLAGCSDDDDITIEQPSSQGVFIDERDGKEYHYIHIGGLDWSVENLAYDLGNTELSCVYQSASDFEKQKYTLDNLEKYGMLYSYEGAQQAVPEGWRLPTDADWKKLEAAHGYLCKPFGLLYGGYFTKNTAATAYNGNRFMGSWAYFWTATKDSHKVGEYYFARKKFYNNQEMERLSIEPTAYFLSVRFVR